MGVAVTYDVVMPTFGHDVTLGSGMQGPRPGLRYIAG